MSEPVKIRAFLCSTSQGKKLRVTFHGVLPEAGAHIQIGPKLFKVTEIVHQLNLYGGELHGDSAIVVFVKADGGSLYAEADSYEEVSHAEFDASSAAAIIKSLF